RDENPADAHRVDGRDSQLPPADPARIHSDEPVRVLRVGRSGRPPSQRHGGLPLHLHPSLAPLRIANQSFAHAPLSTPPIMSTKFTLSRRTFLKSSLAGASLAAFPQILSSRAWGATSANNRLNVALIGCGNRSNAILP